MSPNVLVLMTKIEMHLFTACIYDAEMMTMMMTNNDMYLVTTEIRR